jgi:DNA modification methylase
MASKNTKRSTAVGAGVIPQEYEMVPIGSIEPHPDNVNQGDLGAVIESVDANQFYGAVLVQRSSSRIIAGKHRWLAAKDRGLKAVPVIWLDVDDDRARRIMLADNRTTRLGMDDPAALAALLQQIEAETGTLLGTGFDQDALDEILADLGLNGGNPDEDVVPEPPVVPVSRAGDLWLCGPHRVLCGDCTSPEVVAHLLGDRKPILMVTDPPYGIELDSEWRDRAGLNGCGPAEASYMKHRTEGHTETTISGDTRADWSEAFELVPSLQIAYVWHASIFTREVLNGLLRIGFLYPQQLIWNKGRTVLTRTHYWYQHEPCWYVRKKNAPWFGKAGQNSTIWDSPSPKFIMGGSDEEKFDHPTQKPVELMRRPILNHTKRGGMVYEPFLGSGTTLAAAELTDRVCLGLELDPKYVDVIAQRWQGLSGKEATLDGDGRTFADVAAERRSVPAGAEA